jgi:hypothetical protein
MSTLAPTSPLRGRAVELRTLVDALGRAAGGRPAVVIVEGEAGIGQSRLLADSLGYSRSSPDPRRAAIAALICLHLIVGVALILGFTRLMPRPYRGAGQAADHPRYHA